MKKNYVLLFAMTLGFLTFSCSSDDDSSDDSSDDVEQLVGAPGNPRFNLQFTNPDNVDLDLYVKTPGGTIIYYANAAADGGTLDVDCFCGDCSQGPNENIFWENGTAPTGTFEYWVEYFGSCSGDSPSSNFTLRVVKNNSVITTKTGTLTSGTSSVWSHTQD